MRMCVDHRRCDTSGICVQALPRIFRFEPGSKKAVVAIDSVPIALEARCREVAAKCPTLAICIIEEIEEGSP